MFRPIILEDLILRYKLKGKARTRPDILRVDLGTWHNVAHVIVRPRKKMGPKTKIT